MNPLSTDRREHERYDVLGALWGVLELPESVAVLNASRSGLLVEAALSPVLNSVQAVSMLVDGTPVRVNAVVRHCRPGQDGRNLIGLEFLEPPTPVVLSIEQLTADTQVEVIDLETSRS